MYLRIRIRVAGRRMRMLMLLAGVLASASVRPASLAGQEHFAIVVDPANSINDLSLADLRRIFLGEMATWPGGHPVRLLMPASGSPARAVVLRNIYGFGEADLNRFLIQRTFQSSARAGPILVSAPAMTRRLVGEIPGAIGIVPLSEATGTLKILTVSGRRPGSPGYPLIMRAGRR